MLAELIVDTEAWRWGKGASGMCNSDKAPELEIECHANFGFPIFAESQ